MPRIMSDSLTLLNCIVLLHSPPMIHQVVYFLSTTAHIVRNRTYNSIV